MQRWGEGQAIDREQFINSFNVNARQQQADIPLYVKQYLPCAEIISIAHNLRCELVCNDIYRSMPVVGGIVDLEFHDRY